MRMFSLLEALGTKNIYVFLEEGKVKVNAEEKYLTDEFLSWLRSIKGKINDYLTEIEKLNRMETSQVLRRLMDKGCFFELVANGETAFYPGYLLTEAENDWLIRNHEVVMAALFQVLLLQNVFKQSPSLLQDFKIEVIERVGMMEDSNEPAAYLNGVLFVSRKWWLSCQWKEITV
jgi:hypothetical protein